MNQERFNAIREAAKQRKADREALMENDAPEAEFQAFESVDQLIEAVERGE